MQHLIRPVGVLRDLIGVSPHDQGIGGTKGHAAQAAGALVLVDANLVVLLIVPMGVECALPHANLASYAAVIVPVYQKFR